MKALCLLSIFAFWVCCFSCPAADNEKKTSFNPSDWRDIPSDWQVEAKLEKAAYVAGTAIPLFLIMHNLTETPKRLATVYPFVDYTIEVKKAGGMVVPYTELVAKLRGPAFMASIRSDLVAPGEDHKDTLNLAEYFQLTEPGTYTVFVRRNFSRSEVLSRGQVVPEPSPRDPKPVVFTIAPR